MLFDTHAHLNFAVFDKDRKEMIKKCLENNVWMINIGTNYETSKKAVEIAGKYNEGVYAAIGLHPINLETNLMKQKFDENEGGRFEKEFNYGKYKKLALSSKKIVAIGEIGLDYWRKPKTKKKLAEFKNKQKNLLLQEIKLAQELELPIIFHCRMAHDDLIKILQYKEVGLPKGSPTSKKAVIHCFTGTWEQSEKFLEMGFYLGFNGIVFKLDLDEIIKKTPLNRILIETDCPFLTPPNFNEEKNNPLGVKFVAEHIAKIRNLPLEKIAEITSTNAKTLFKI
ncbi:TatD family hydrolase [Candidatus Parcubacteria bacterium]|nr:TatD family hydrolase [Candidatus Parcubacteria bacterium]